MVKIFKATVLSTFKMMRKFVDGKAKSVLPTISVSTNLLILKRHGPRKYDITLNYLRMFSTSNTGSNKISKIQNREINGIIIND